MMVMQTDGRAITFRMEYMKQSRKASGMFEGGPVVLRATGVVGADVTLTRPATRGTQV